jgi:predicted alpha/beta-fold hydrolase
MPYLFKKILAPLLAESGTVNVYTQPQSIASQLAQQLDQLSAGYSPTPWLFNEHFQLLKLVFGRKRSHDAYDHHEQLSMSDGGRTALAWMGYHLPSTTPTIVILHTISGNPDSMHRLAEDLHQSTGWRVVVCVRRGHAGLPLPVAKINILGSTDDLREQLNIIESRFPASTLYGIGSSAGSGLLIRYLGEAAEQSKFKAAFAYCPGYNTDEAFERAHPVYSRLMVQTLIREFIQPHWQQLAHLATAPQLKAAKNLNDFHQHGYELAGFNSYDAYSKASNPMWVFDKITVPLMVLNAEDDPLCRIENLEPYLPLIQKMPNVTLVTTSKGSHCAHYEHWSATSWAHRLMANYFLKIEKLAQHQVAII